MTSPARNRPVRSPARSGGELGQTSVELLAIVPLLVSVALAVAGLLAGQRAREAADQAAVAAAVAQLQGGDAEDAAKAASPGWTRTKVRVSGGKVTVTIRPRVPKALAGLIDAERTVVFDVHAGAAAALRGVA